MTQKTLFKTTLAIAVATSFGVADAKIKPDTSYVNTALEWAPADSFMVLGNTQPYTSAEGKLYTERMNKVMSAQSENLLKMLKSMQSMAADEANAAEKAFIDGYVGFLTKFYEAMDGNWSSVFAKSSSAFYFDGIIPVLRWDSVDAAFTNALKSSLSEYLPAATPLEVEGKKFDTYEIPMDDAPFTGLVVTEITDTSGVIAFMPAEMKDHYIKRNFITPVSDSVWSSGKLAAMRDKYEYNGLSEGYIDFKQIRDTVFNAADSKDPIIAMGGAMVPNIAEEAPGCYEFVNTWTDNMPRFVFGIEESAANYDRISMTFEASAAVTDILKIVPSDIPGTEADQDSMISFGVGSNLTGLQTSLGHLANTFEKANEQCPSLDFPDMQDAIRGMNDAFNPMVTQFNGFSIIINNAELGSDGEPDPATVDAAFVVSVDDAEAAMGMAAMMGLPLDIKTNGKPIKVPASQLPAEMKGQTIMMAADEDNIAMAMGDSAKSQIKAILKDDTIDDTQLIRYHVNFSKLMSSDIIKAAMSDDMGGAGMPSELIDSMLEMYEMYNAVDFSVNFTQHGIELEVQQGYNL